MTTPKERVLLKCNGKCNRRSFDFAQENKPLGWGEKASEMREIMPAPKGFDAQAAWKSMVSAVTPGPKDMAQPCWPDWALARTCCRTNMTVAEDMLP